MWYNLYLAHRQFIHAGINQVEIKDVKQNAKNPEDDKIPPDASAADDTWSARGWILGFAAVLVAAAVFLLITQVPKTQLPAWNRPVLGCEILTLFWVALAGLPALALFRIALHKTRRKMMRGLKRFVLCIISVCVCIAAFDIICATYPELQGSFVRNDVLWPCAKLNVEDKEYGFRGAPNLRTIFVFDPAKDGNALLPGQGPWPLTGEKKIKYTIHHDAQGFPNPGVPRSAGWVVVGDSFAHEAATPEGKEWITALRESVKGDLYDMAVNGWGPACEYRALRDYGLPLKPRVVVWSFFEGNDLRDAGGYQQFKAYQQDTGLGWGDYIAWGHHLPPRRFPYNRPVVRLLLYVAALLNPPEKSTGDWTVDMDPITLTTGGHSLLNAVDAPIFRQMMMDDNYIKQWDNWIITDYVLNQSIDMCKKQGITFVLLYFPDKARVYLPLIEAQVDRESFYNSIAPVLPRDWQQGAKTYFRDVDRNQSCVCRFVKNLCEKKNVLFIDTTDCLSNAVKEGVFPYWAYDSHLNPEGHKIVTKTILRELRKAKLLPSGD